MTARGVQVVEAVEQPVELPAGEQVETNDQLPTVPNSGSRVAPVPRTGPGGPTSVGYAGAPGDVRRWWP